MNADPKPRRCWFHSRLNWVLFALLGAEGFLLLARKFGWFGFDGDAYGTVGFAVAAVTISIICISFWIVVRFAFRRQFQYSLRTLMLVMVAACVGMGLGWG